MILDRLKKIFTIASSSKSDRVSQKALNETLDQLDTKDIQSIIESLQERIQGNIPDLVKTRGDQEGISRLPEESPVIPKDDSPDDTPFHERAKEEKEEESRQKSNIGQAGRQAPTRGLTHKPHEIIPINSPFTYQQRNLISAEILTKEKEYDMAIEIYSRLIEKIPHRKIRDKLETNLQDIKNIQQRSSSEKPGISQEPTPQHRAQDYPPPPPSRMSQIVQTISQSDMAFREAMFDVQEMKKTDLTGAQGEPDVGSKPDELVEGKDPQKERFKLPSELTAEPMRIKGLKEEHQEASPKPDETETPAEEAGEAEEEEGFGFEPSSVGSGKAIRSKATPQDDLDFEDLDAELKEEEEEAVAPAEEKSEEKPLPQEVHGVFDIKPPEAPDSPFLSLTYDFTKIPYDFYLSKDNQLFEYTYYKYKPMLVKAHRFIRSKQISKALNYYKAICDQEVPDEFKSMIQKNIQDINDFMGKYFS